MSRAVLLLLLFVSCTVSGRTGTGSSGLLLIVGGTIITLDDSRPEVEAVLVREGFISAIGTLDQVMSEPGAAEAERFDLNGQVLYPGFVDGHAHLVGIGRNMLQVDVMGTDSYEAVVERVQRFAERNPVSEGGWIQGRGWDQNDWPNKRFPSHQLLSRAFPDTPVVLGRVDGHAILANRKAMDIAGINANTPDPEGGAIVRDRNGRATGVFIDAAESLISRHVPESDSGEIEQVIKLASKALQRSGITAIHDAGIDQETIDICRRLAARGELGIRVYGLVPGSNTAQLDNWLDRGPFVDPTGQVTVRAIKLYADGALGSRGAALLEDYSDDPGNRGLLITPEARIQEVSERALESGFQVCTHAIGDRANRLVLDAYEAAFEKLRAAGGSLNDHRFRVEHAQVVAPEDIPRFRQLGVIPSMQAQHQASDSPWVEDRLGPARVKGAYAWRSLLETGVVICGGSDSPVEVLDPIGAFRAAVTRTNGEGWPDGGWYAEQCMTRREALLHLTAWPAFAAFEEDVAGVLRPGVRADFTVLDVDLRAQPEPQLDEARVTATIFDGEVVFQARSRSRR
ncbi:MAG: amidohydrolase [Planctomycetes bacterium]|nr:amidohydrolase [Planctomycetota bacterium]